MFVRRSLLFALLTMLSVLGTKVSRAFRLFPHGTTLPSRFLSSSTSSTRLVEWKSAKRSTTEIAGTSFAATSTSSFSNVAASSRTSINRPANNNNNNAVIADYVEQSAFHPSNQKFNKYSATKFQQEQLQQESIMARTPVNIVRTVEEAHRCLAILHKFPEAVWACDTEVIKIDIKEQSPVGNGKVICASIYGGDEIDFGTGSTLWVENAGEAEGILQIFKNWFENPAYKKVWHNYGFDRHVMANEGIHCQGFYGDTMHMARLWDTSRDKMASGGGSGEGYSLSSLTSSLFSNHPKSAYFVKSSMLDLFGVAKLKKDGTESKKKELPDLLVLQNNPETREKWIEYSARDAVATWWLHEALTQRLKRMPWIVHTHDKIHNNNDNNSANLGGKLQGNMFDFYQRYWRDFGELLTDMEANGIKVDTQRHLKDAEQRARQERLKMERLFLSWARDMCPEAKDINIASTTQIQQLLFGHFEAFEKISDTRTFTIEKTEAELENAKNEALKANPYSLLSSTELKDELKKKNLKLTGKREDLLERLLLFDQDPDESVKRWGNALSRKKLLKDEYTANPSAEAMTGEKYYAKLKLADVEALCDARGLIVTSIENENVPTVMVDGEKSEMAGSKTSNNKTKKLKKADYVAALVADDATRASALMTQGTASDETHCDTPVKTYDTMSLTELRRTLALRHLDWQCMDTPTTHLASTSTSNATLLQRGVDLLNEFDNLSATFLDNKKMEDLMVMAQDTGVLEYVMTQQPQQQQDDNLMTLLVSHLVAVEISKRHDKTVFYDPQMHLSAAVTASRDTPVSDLDITSSTTLRTNNNNNNSSTNNNNSNSKDWMKKTREFTITTIGMQPLEFTSTGLPQVSAAILKKLAGKNLFTVTGEINENESEIQWGEAFQFFGGGEAGKNACRAIGALAAVGQVDATINNFLVPLQALVDKNQRIHCSLNLNTETGRLSSRRPNLQNQPALEKDPYKIRDAFVADNEDYTFIVADYGQLELRILAHITHCQSMIEAFRQGGCFHSRTAMGMYPYIQESVEAGKVLLEWDYSQGQPTVPLVKDTFSSERRKAKTLNFSIAYGKTVHGLAQDWGISKEEAEETLNAWYRDRPEVKKWQSQTQQLAMDKGYVMTMMGRYRRLPDARPFPSSTSTSFSLDTTSSSDTNSNNNSNRGGNRAAMGHALRAAINTPIQGSAADVVMMAMLKLWKSPVLKALDWKLLLQIHDEVILEGPKATRDEAMKEVRHCMENPFDDVGLSKLLVHLDVDAKSADTWYKAK